MTKLCRLGSIKPSNLSTVGCGLKPSLQRERRRVASSDCRATRSETTRPHPQTANPEAATYSHQIKSQKSNRTAATPNRRSTKRKTQMPMMPAQRSSMTRTPSAHDGMHSSCFREFQRISQILNATFRAQRTKTRCLRMETAPSINFTRRSVSSGRLMPTNACTAPVCDLSPLFKFDQFHFK